MTDHNIATTYDTAVRHLLELPEVKRAFAKLEASVDQVVADTIRITEVEAPPFKEDTRADLVAGMMRQAGLADVHVDAAKNAVGTIKGSGDGKAVILAAHIDTVFPAGTDVKVKRDGNILRAPGCGDNSSSVAALLNVARVLIDEGFELPRKVIIAGDAGEEGLGDLSGMKALMKTYGQEIEYALPVDGGIGAVTHAGVGSRRLKVTTHSPGGHSYGAFGVPSAIHGLGRMIALIADIEVPKKPKTTYTVGVIGGGTSVNTIAGEAWMLIDMRSESSAELAKLEEKVRGCIAAGAERGDVSVDIEVVGDRPAGSIPLESELPQMVMAVHRALGIQSEPGASSTDANVPLGMGIQGVTIGIKQGGDAHRLTDYAEIDSFVPGMKSVMLSILMATGYRGK